MTSKLRPTNRVIRPRGRARIHLADLQAARVHIPNIAILAQVRVVESAVPFRQRRNVILNKHGLAKRLFVDRLVGNGQAALLAVRTKILHQVGDKFLALAGGKCARHKARARVVIRVLHQIDCGVPLLFIPLLVWQEIGTVAHDAGSFNRLARMARGIQLVVRNQRLAFRKVGAHLLVRPVRSLFQCEVRSCAPACSDRNFLDVSAGEAILRDAHFVIAGEKIHGLIAPALGEHHVDDVLVHILSVDFRRFEFLGSLYGAGDRTESGKCARRAGAGAFLTPALGSGNCCEAE